MGAPKINIYREPPDIRPVVGLPTTVWYVACVTERGPVGVPTLCTGYGAYRGTFGDMLASPYYGALSLSRAFAGRGAKRFWVNRIVHFTDPDDKTTKTSAASTIMIQSAAGAATSGYVLGTIAEPFDLEPSDTIRVVTDAVDTTCTFTATAGLRENGIDETYALADGETLTVSIDGGGAQTITFLTGEFVDILNATAEEVAAVVNAKVVGASATATSLGARVTITSDKRGTDSGVNVTGGTANGALQFAVGNIAGTGNVPNIDAVTAAQAAAVIIVVGVTASDAAGYVKVLRDATGPAATVQVHAASTADDEMGLDNAVHAGTSGAAADTLKVDASSDGTWADGATGGLDVQAVVPATSGVATEFDLVVRYNDKQVERHNNMNMGTANITSPRYCETIINGVSDYITVVDTAANSELPDTVEHALAGGGDGLAGLVAGDFTGKVGLDSVLAVTDAVMNLWFPDRTTLTTIKTIVDFCELYRYSLVFDPLVSNSPATWVAAFIAAGLKDYSEMAWYGYPWVKIANPDKAVFGQADVITVPPSGGMVAACVTQDSKQGGVHEAPCGLENGHQKDVIGLEYDEVNDFATRDFLCSNRANVIHKSKGGKYFLANTDTLKITDSFPSIGASRGTLYIEKTLDVMLEWITDRNINKKIYRRIKSQIKLFLVGEMYNGAFYYDDDADKAFSINIGADINPASVKYKGRIKIKISLAKANPVKDVDISISKDVREIAAEIFGA